MKKPPKNVEPKESKYPAKHTPLTIDELKELVIELVDYPQDVAETYRCDNYDDTEYVTLKDDDLQFCLQFQHCTNVVCVDNKRAFNKVSQCPIFFSFPLSKCKRESLLKALAYLRTPKGSKESCTFSFNDWPEFSRENSIW